MMEFIFRSKKSSSFCISLGTIFFTLVTQSATHTIYPQLSRTSENYHANTTVHFSNNTNIAHPFHLSQSLVFKIENITEEINEFLAIIQLNSDYSNRHKRGSINAPTNSTNKQLLLIENEISDLRQKITLIKSSLSLNTEDKYRIDGLERSVENLRKSFDNQNQNIEQVLSSKDDKLHSLAQSLNSIRLDFDDTRKRIEQKEVEEAKRRLYDDIVRLLQSHQLSEAEQKLQQADDPAYIYAVKKVYNNQAGNFDLLLSFGDSIRNWDNKLKIFDALDYEIRSNGHGDVRRLVRLSQSIKKGILDISSNATKAQLLFNNLNNAIQEAAVEAISNAFLKDDSWPMVKQLSADIEYVCVSCLGNIYDKVIDQVFDKVGILNLLIKAHSNLKTIEEQMSVHLAIANKLVHDPAAFVDASFSIAQYVKSTMADSKYTNVNSELRNRYENIKNKFPETIRYIVFPSVVCSENTRCGDFLYIKRD